MTALNKIENIRSDWVIRDITLIDNCIKKVALAVASVFPLIGYFFLYLVHWLGSVDPWTGKRVFQTQDNILTSTHNFGKFSDLPDYVSYWKHPMILQKKALDMARNKGFDPEATFTPSPFGGGKCFGAMATFCRAWLETHDMAQVARLFKGGVPFESSIIQEAYKASAISITYYPELSDLIFNFVNDYSLFPTKETYQKALTKWRNSHFENRLDILEAIRQYIDEGNDSNLALYIRKKVPIEWKIYASAKDAAIKLNCVDLQDAELTMLGLSLAGLKVEAPLLYNSTPEDLLEACKTLQPGAYQVDLPCYSSTGEHQGYHTVGLVISENGQIYLYDPNFALGRIPTQGDLVPTIGRLLTEYTGMDYSTGTGIRPSSGTQFINFFRERANPSKEDVIHGFNLYKIGLAT